MAEDDRPLKFQKITDIERILTEFEDAKTDLRQLRAAIEAFCNESHKHERPFTGWVNVDLLRALLADNGAAALREVKADVWDECVRVIKHAEDDPAGPYPLDSASNPYRDTP